jgi:hypothetical protein
VPVSDRARQLWGRRTAADGARLLDQIDADPVDGWLAPPAPVQALRAIWAQECVVDEAGTWHLRATRIDPGAEHIDSPHDVEARVIDASIGPREVVPRMHCRRRGGLGSVRAADVPAGSGFYSWGAVT